MAFMSKEDRAKHAVPMWDVLTGMAKERATKTYGNVGKLLDLEALDVGWVLDPIQEYCKSKGLPPLTGLVINSIAQKPTFAKTENGHGYHGKEENWEEERDEVFNHPWDNHPNPGYEEFVSHAR